MEQMPFLWSILELFRNLKGVALIRFSSIRFFVKMNRLRWMLAALGFDVKDHWAPQFKRSPGASQLFLRHQPTTPKAQVNCSLGTCQQRPSLNVQLSIRPHQTQLPSINPEATNPNGLRTPKWTMCRLHSAQRLRNSFPFQTDAVYPWITVGFH